MTIEASQPEQEQEESQIYSTYGELWSVTRNTHLQPQYQTHPSYQVYQPQPTLNTSTSYQRNHLVFHHPPLYIYHPYIQQPVTFSLTYLIHQPVTLYPSYLSHTHTR